MKQKLSALFALERLRLIRGRSALAASLGFILLIITLFPFAFGPEKELLIKLSGGLVALALLFAHMLEAARLYQDDLQSGALDMLKGADVPFWLYALLRAGMLGLAHILAFLLLLPLLLLLLHVPMERFFSFAVAAALGGLCLSLSGMALGALTLGARRAGMLLPLLLFPVQIPALVFMTALAGEGFTSTGLQALFFLAALCVFFLLVMPALAGAALRAAVEAS